MSEAPPPYPPAHVPEVSAKILDRVADGFLALDANWHCTYVNARAEILLERRAETLLGRTLWELYPEGVGAPFETLYRQAMETRRAASVTSFFPQHDRWYEVEVYPHDAGGIHVYFRDVTERTRNAKALEEGAALLRGISDATGDVIFAKERDGRFRYANLAALALIGKPLAQVLGKTDMDVLEDKEAARLLMDNDRRIMESGVAEDLEERVPLPDGAHRIWLSRKTPHLEADGAVVGLLGVSRDITERSHATERMMQLHALAASLSEATTTEAVARASLDHGRIALGATAGSLSLLADDGVTVEMAGMFGYSAEAMARWNTFSLDDEIPIAEAIRTGEAVYLRSSEERVERYPALLHANPEKPTMASVSIPLLIGGRTVGTLALSFSDHLPPRTDGPERDFLLSFTRQCAQALERARLFEAERRARVEAERTGKMKDEFLTTLSHELRTPLNAIVGWVSILLTRCGDDADLRKGLLTIQRNARAQTQIIGDLLDMSSFLNGKVRLQVQTADLGAILDGAIETMRPAAEAKGVLLGCVVDPASGPIAGDPGRLQQVFWNLLSNAVKFTPRGGRIQVVLARVRSHVEVTVTDTGAGIPESFLPFVFDRFRQADSSPTRNYGGLGLGLSIVKQLVELHGGSVRVRSAGVGQGSTFVVELPLSSLRTPEPDAPNRPPPAADEWKKIDAGDDLTLAGLRILVVDDEPDARALVERLLQDRKATVRTASSAAEAIAMFVAEPPSVIVSDIGMPNEDGYTLLRRIRSLEPPPGGPVPALALTAYARTEDRVRAMRAGFQAQVAKPVEPVELVTAIAALVGRTGNDDASSE